MATITTGSSVIVESVGSDWNSLAALTTARMIHFYKVDGSITLNARFLDVSGTVITVRSALPAESVPTDPIRSTVSVTRLTDTTCIAVLVDGKALLLSASGDSVSGDFTLNFDGSGFIEWPQVISLSSTKVVAVYTTPSNADKVFSIVIDESAGSLSNGTAVVVSGTQGVTPAIDKLDSTHAIVFFADTNNSDRPTANILTVTGTSIAIGADEVLHTAGSWVDSGGVQEPGHRAIVAMSSTSAIAIWQDNTTKEIFGCGMTISGTTITAGTVISITPGANVDEYPCLAKIDATNALMFYDKTVTGDAFLRTLSLSGNTLTATADEVTVVSGTTPSYLAIARIDTANFICAWHQTTGDESRAIIAQVSGLQGVFDYAHSSTGIPGSII